MKSPLQRLLAILFIISLSQIGNSQSLLSHDNLWYMGTYSFFGDVNTYMYRVGDSIVVGGNTRYNIETSTDSLLLNWTPTDSYLREDSTSKVYVSTGSGAESLLYDFSPEVGDTFVFATQLCDLTVTSIDSILLENGELRKRILLHDPYNAYPYAWIKGIGSRNGLLEYQSGICIIDGGFGLRCFEQNGQILYNPISYSSCFISTSNDNIDGSSLIGISPNPTKDKIFVDLPTELASTQFTIFSSSGQLVLEGSLDQNQLAIDVGELATGLYILTLTLENGESYSQKIVKE